MIFENGDRVEWTYQHSLNRKSKTYITKQGTFLRRVDARKSNRAKRIPQWNSETSPYAIVLFDGNKTPSKVIYDELQAAKSS